ncbi:acyl-CoA dehydrogenase family protein [Salicibibacter kimchii]|nr:acyl-CoA dehydrogenase family protein [Salicibibacter kimchii]
MNFDFTEEQNMLKRSVRKLSTEVLEPAIQKQERDIPFSKNFSLRMLKELQPYGFLDNTIAEENGGSGLDPLTYALMYEEIPIDLKSLVGISSSFTKGIANNGTESQKERFLPGLLSGDKIGCSAITEPNVGSNAAMLKTSAYLDGDEWVVNGTKTFISNGQIADYVNVVVQFDSSKKGKGLGTLIIEKEESPFQVKPLQTLGFKNGHLAELYFDNVRVPKENLLNPEGTGLKSTLIGFQTYRCFVATHANSLAQKALDYSLEYVKEREQFGRPIGSFQLVQEMLADMKTDVDASKLITYRALDMLSKGRRCPVESSMAKQFATEMAVRVTSKAIQIHGAYGLTTEFPLEGLFRNARMLTIPDGTTQIQKMIMGRELTGLRAFD